MRSLQINAAWPLEAFIPFKRGLSKYKDISNQSTDEIYPPKSQIDNQNNSRTDRLVTDRLVTDRVNELPLNNIVDNCCSLFLEPTHAGTSQFNMNRPIRLTQCCTQFRSPGDKILCVFHLHYNVAFTFK